MSEEQEIQPVQENIGFEYKILTPEAKISILYQQLTELESQLYGLSLEEPIVEEVVVEEVAPVVVTKTFETQTIGTGSFALNSTTLKPESAAKLDDLVAFLNEYPQANVDVIGYTDTSGPAAYNQKVSEKRAESVANALVEKGIDASRIHARGEGENNPIASNDTREGREQNRRVEVVVPEFEYQVQQ